MKAYNTCIHEGTEYTPHELVFRRLVRVLTSNILLDDKSNESYPEYATDYLSEYSTLKHHEVHENLEMQKLDLLLS